MKINSKGRLPLKIYNTLTRKKEEFIPHQANRVNIYVCGPTVYNLLHIGNMRCYVVFDTVRRYLEYKKYKVTMIQNFTDVDDRIIQRSLEEGISPQAVADKYIDEAFVDYKALGICPADHYPRVTEEMDKIIEMISQLIEARYAYVREGHVFFDTHKSKGYGKLSGKNVDDLLAGARVEINDQKQSPVDFVLWKPNKPGEPYWESPWGTGRPGWHIECSAMVKEYLQGNVDIHGGGEDLIFPHHENEIAQSEALQDAPFVKYWMHNGMLTNKHKKMSKSLGNFFTFRDVAERFPPEIIRFFLLSGHYRMPLEYSEALLESAQKGFARIKKCWELLGDAAKSGAETLSENEAIWLKEAEAFKRDFEARMEDDFNTADAISVVFELVKFINVKMHEQDISKPFAKGMQEILDQLLDLLGLAQTENTVHSNEDEIEALIAQRQEARKNKNWAEADKIRDDLLAQGIVLEDTPTGVRWTAK